MPVLSLACHLPHNAPHIPWRYNYEQTTKQTKAINNSYIYIYINISCKCDTNRAGHLTLDAYASRPVAWRFFNAAPNRFLPVNRLWSDTAYAAHQMLLDASLPFMRISPMELCITTLKVVCQVLKIFWNLKSLLILQVKCMIWITLTQNRWHFWTDVFSCEIWRWHRCVFMCKILLKYHWE